MVLLLQYVSTGRLSIQIVPMPWNGSVLLSCLLSPRPRHNHNPEMLSRTKKRKQKMVGKGGDDVQLNSHGAYKIRVELIRGTLDLIMPRHVNSTTYNQTQMPKL